MKLQDPHRPPAPGPQGAHQPAHDGRRRGHHRRRPPPGLQPPRHREAGRGEDLDPEHLPDRAHLRHLLPLPRHLLRPGRREAHGARAPPKRGLYIRYLVSELERVHSHLLWLGVAGHEAGFDSFFMYTWRDREIVMDLLEMISGNRVHYAINTLGGVRRDLDEGQKAKILEGVATLRKRSEYYLEIGATEPSFVARLAGVGMLTQGAGRRPLRRRARARASGVARDVRKDDPYAVYDELAFEVCTADTCDVLGRVVVRVKELLESYKIIEQMLKNLPDGDSPSRRRARPSPARSSAATRRPAARTSTTSRPTARTSPSASRSGPRRWPTTRPRSRCSRTASSPTSP